VTHRQSRDADESIGSRPLTDARASDVARGEGDPAFAPPAADYEPKSAARESLTLLHALWRSRHRLRVILLSVGIAAVLVANMAGQIRLNEWNGAFFDALQQRNLGTLGHQLLIFFIIIGVLLALVVGQTWMQQMLKVRLREWLTHHLLDRWLVAGRAYRLGLAG
jgi:putative ATP-binding cassette transporter